MCLWPKFCSYLLVSREVRQTMWNYLSELHGTSGNVGKFSRRLALCYISKYILFDKSVLIDMKDVCFCVCQKGLCVICNLFINRDNARLWVILNSTTFRSFLGRKRSEILWWHLRTPQESWCCHHYSMLICYEAGVTNVFVF